MVRWCWINFQCRGVLLICMIVGQGPTALAVGGGCLDIFSRLSFSLFFLSLSTTARYSWLVVLGLTARLPKRG